jgi:DNA-binding XRE family transcriptional regulator
LLYYTKYVSHYEVKGMAKKNLALKSRIIEQFGTQADFAPEVDMREPILSRLINGRDKPKPEQAQRIAAALGCKVEEIFK